MKNFSIGWRELQSRKHNPKLTREEKFYLIMIIAIFLLQAYFEQPY